MMYMHHMTLPVPSEAPLPPQAIIEVCFCHHARRTARAISRVFDEALAPAGIKSNQFNILVAIAAGDVTSVGTVAKMLAMDRTTLSRNLKPLREAGYISSEGGAGRRPDALTLTETGQAVLNRAVSYWRGAQRVLTERLGASQSSLLLHAFEKGVRAATP